MTPNPPALVTAAASFGPAATFILRMVYKSPRDPLEYLNGSPSKQYRVLNPKQLSNRGRDSRHFLLRIKYMPVGGIGLEYTIQETKKYKPSRGVMRMVW